MKPTLIFGAMLTTYVFLIFYIFQLINTYYVNNEWNSTIKELGSTYSQRVLILIHMTCDIYVMLIYPIQLFVSRILKLHICLGITICISMIISSVCGLSYIFLYRTIGGIPMTICFIVNGILAFAISLVMLILNVKYRTTIRSMIIATQKIKTDNTSDLESSNNSKSQNIVPSEGLMFSNSIVNEIENDENVKLLNPDINIIIEREYKNLHFVLSSLMGAQIYSSLFYRLLYTYSQLARMPLPTTYQRPIDIIFGVLFIAIPITFALSYAFNKHIQKYGMGFLIIFNIFNIFLIFF